MQGPFTAYLAFEMIPWIVAAFSTYETKPSSFDPSRSPIKAIKTASFATTFPYQPPTESSCCPRLRSGVSGGAIRAFLSSPASSHAGLPPPYPLSSDTSMSLSCTRSSLPSPILRGHRHRANEGNPRDLQSAPLQRGGVREPPRATDSMARATSGPTGKSATRSTAQEPREGDVIELSSDSDGAARRRRSSSDASPSRHMRKPTEWAFLESPSGSSNDDSDDFEARKPAKKAKGKTAKSTPVKSNKPKKKRSFSEEEIDERPRRVAQRHLFSEHLTVSELQAQERELARLQRLSQKQQHASPKPKPTTTKAPRTVDSRSPKAKPTAGIVRTVLATTLARKQQPTRKRDSSPPPSKRKANKRRLEESEDEEEEEEEEEAEEDSDDFEDDFVEAKKAALRASLALTQKSTTALGAQVLKKTALSRPRSPSPSPPPTPPRSRPAEAKKSSSKKTAASTKPVTAKQSKSTPTPPAIEEPRRKRNETGLLSDWFSVGELQAQEREWSRLQRDINIIKSTLSPTPTPQTKSKTQSSRQDPSSRSQRGRAPSESSDDMSLVEIVQLIEEDEDDDSKNDGDFVLELPVPSSKKTSSNKGSKSKKRGGSHSKPSIPSASKSTSNGKFMELLPKPRTAVDTVPHWTTWRGLKFSSAPANLLLLPSSVLPPFVSNADKPLVEFDTSGELDTKCQLLASFGKTKTFLLSNDTSKPELSQEAMNDRVMELLETWTPQIKGCYGRKSEAILREAREKVQEYTRLRDEHHHSIVQHAVRRDPRMKYEKLSVCKAELSIAKQLQLPRVLSPLDAMGTIKIGRGDTFLVEKDTIAETALELASVRPISRSTTYTGIKASVRVEDDPILRYVPYFGDNDDGDAIDVKAYEAIQAKQAAEGAKSCNGLDNEAHEYMLRLVISECGDQETVFNALKQVAGFAQPYTEYMEIKKRRESRNNARKRIDETKTFLAGQHSHVVEDEEATRKAINLLTSDLHPFASESRVDVPLSERFASQWTYFDTNLLPSQTRPSKGFRPLLGLRLTTDYGDLSETYRDLFCRMCYKYDCHEHGIEHPIPTRRVDPLYPTTRFAPVAAQGARGAPGDDQPKNEPGCDKLHEEPASVSTGTDESVEGDEEVVADATQATDMTDIVSESSATTAESQELIDLSASEPRRSSRSGTRASTMATISVESQLAAQGIRARSQRQRPKVPPKRTNGDVSEYLDDSHLLLVSTKVKSFLKAGETCGSTCWKAKHDVTEESTKPSTGADAFNEPEDEIKAKLNAAELLVLQKLRYTVGDNACMIGAVLQSSLSCREIHAYLVSQQRSKPVDEQGYFSPEVSGKKNRKRGRATAALPGNNRELLKRTRHQRLKDTSIANHDYEPCNHEGICDYGASCSCMKRDHMCEKACSCSRDCPNRFQGCKCSMGNCRTNQCPCFVALRECNPDLCGSCGASDVPVLVYNPEYKNVSSQDLGICCNVNVQRGLHKRIGVSYSRTHGWGAFALEPIKRGEFIYEYVGAIISHDEAERRGTIYDKLNISFLFDLNEDSVADAIRTGNKSKFCNHANVGQKCHARIFRVGGEHHISIWANADIQKGEELFFNYGYHGESAPVWSQGARITESSKREAAAAADELQE